MIFMIKKVEFLFIKKIHSKKGKIKESIIDSVSRSDFIKKVNKEDIEIEFN